MRYRVELEELLGFVDRLQSFEQRAEAIAARVDGQIATMHGTWAGNAAAAHRAQHDEWMAVHLRCEIALGASAAVAATLVWILPVGRYVDAFHGIA